MGQHPVNIVYPVNGGTYPIVDPHPVGVKSAYFTASFGTTCPGGPYPVEWGFDATTLGKTQAYDEFSAQFTWKLPAGGHVFWVRTKCGENKVEFKIA
ncbi:MAG TPA: hypothetical protein VM733_09310 [Thermoanaerobaculia bacterium]|nr:hypothetical protein [Thermoanaerobaculia bacterium]